MKPTSPMQNDGGEKSMSSAIKDTSSPLPSPLVRFWKRFDELAEPKRFFWFLAFIAIPSSVLIGLKQYILWGCYALFAVLSRTYASYKLRGASR